MKRALLGLVGALSTGCGPAETGPLVAFLGDSLTSGWRLPEREAYPALVQHRLREKGRAIRVLNAGVSGDTVAQGRARLEGVLGRKPDVLVVALGINDGLRGMDIGDVDRGLRAVVERSREAQARVVLVGMAIPPESQGPDYARRFAALYPRIAADHGLGFVPFLLAGVAGRPDLCFADGLHPNARGQARLAENVLPQVELAIAEVLHAAGR
jgi:acyl-CoA thioesterase-1